MIDLSRHVMETLGISLSAKQIEAFNTYEELLIEENQFFNLTAIKDSDEIKIKHFLDSLTCFYFINTEEPARIFDVGTGAGFPGIPLKIVNPSIDLTLVESVEKKTNFCKKITKNLNLSDVSIIHSRAESIGADLDFRETFDWAIARAVAPLATLSEYLLPLVKIGGRVLAQKGKQASSEIELGKTAVNKLGGEFAQVKSFLLPVFEESRTLITILKVLPTPPEYPRRSGIPSKKPIT
jgi:16S rRNA (guanine527-N7)-methyltransferase